jgi:hypothetical protein
VQWTTNVADDGVASIEGAPQQPTPQQPTSHQPTSQETGTVAPHAESVSTPGWTEVPAQPTPTPTYNWQSSTTSSDWPVAVLATGTRTSARSSSARIWAVAITVIVAIAGVGATAVIALGRNDDNGLSALSGDRHYSASFEQGFIHGCTGNGGTAGYCQCALTHIEQNYDVGEVEDMAKSYISTGKLPDAMVSVGRECAPQQFKQ